MVYGIQHISESDKKMILPATLLRQAYVAQYLAYPRITYCRVGGFARGYTTSEGRRSADTEWWASEFTTVYMFGEDAPEIYGINYLDTPYSRYCEIEPGSDAKEMISEQAYNRNRAFI